MLKSIISELTMLLPVLCSLVMGAVLGWQREHWGKAAGPRTYALVSTGSALFTVLSVHAFGDDIARVAAGIVTGIGFLGVGTILHREDHIEGLTTAAGLWMVAAIGMATGVGYYLLAGATTLIVLFLLMLHEDSKKPVVKKRIK